MAEVASVELTEADLQRIEANRQKALAIRRERLAQQQTRTSRSDPSNTASSSNETSKPIAPIFCPPVTQNKPISTSISHSSAPQPPETISINCSVISKERFEAIFRYNPTALNVCQQMSTKRYNGIKKTWSFALTEYETFRSAIKKTFGEKNTTFLGPPDFVLSALRKENSRTANTDTCSLHPSIMSKLFPYQIEGINSLIARGGRAMLADDMGLGKTVQALGVAQHYSKDRPLLIVCPSSMTGKWVEEVFRWIPGISDEAVVELQSDRGSREMLETKQYRRDLIVVTSYDTLSNRVTELCKLRFQFTILDESHYVKTFKAKRSKAAQKVCRGSRRLLLLTGTPALSRPSELFNQINILEPKMIPGGFKPFAYRYCDGKMGKFAFDASGATNLGELQILLESTIMLRRMKVDVMNQLPAKTRISIVLDKSSVKTNLKALQSAREKMVNQRNQSNLMEFYKESAVAKRDAAVNYVLDLLEGDQKILIFAHHQSMMDAINFNIAAKYRCIRIDGAVPPSKRKELVDEFQNNDDVRAAVLSIKAANTGLTLTEATAVVFAELHWVPGDLIQAEDRAHRVGQKQNVTCYYLVARGTIDDHVWPMLSRKLDVLNQAGLSKTDFTTADTELINDAPGETAGPTKKNSDGDIMQFLEEISVVEGTEAKGCDSNESVSISENDFDVNPIAKKARIE